MIFFKILKIVHSANRGLRPFFGKQQQMQERFVKDCRNGKESVTVSNPGNDTELYARMRKNLFQN